MPVKIPADRVVDWLLDTGELVHVTGDEGMAAYWLPQEGLNPDNPATFRAPIKVGSQRFRLALREAFPSIMPTRSRTKDYAEAAEAHAYGGRALTEVGWSDSDGRGTERVIRIAINLTTVVAIHANGQVTAEPNGQHNLYRLPAKFEPIWWSDLAAAAARVPNPCALNAVRTALADDLPAPVAQGALSPADQTATVLSWWAGLLLEPVCRGRPMLVMLGEPGSGKTLTAQLLGTLYYGEGFEVGGGAGGSRAVKDLLASVVHVPVAVADDLTNVKREAIDTLCRVATGSEVQLATLHETMHLSTFKARAATILTSARPEWALRDDLLTRILPVRFDKPGASPLTSQDRIDRVLQHRVDAWYELIMATASALMHRGRPTPLTRFEDWEANVRTIAAVGGWEAGLVSALSRMPTQRVRLAAYTSLEVGALYAIACDFRDNPRAWTVAELYDLVMERMGAMLSEDQRYRPSGRMRIQEFSKFLRRVESEGSSAVTLRSCPGDDGTQRWTITPKA